MCKVEGTHYWQWSSWKQNISYLYSSGLFIMREIGLA